MTDEKDTKAATTEPQEEKKPEAETATETPEVKSDSADTTADKEKKAEKTSAPADKEEKEEEKEEAKIPDLKPGMTVRVYQKIKELNAKGEEKERIQYFEGMIIAKKHGKEIGGTITVRKVSDGIGVEKIFPLNLPTIDKIEIKKQARVKRAKLYFLKNLKKPFRKKLKEVKMSK